MARQQETKDAQISMVLAKHYDHPASQQIAMPDQTEAPLDHLMDVTNLSDEQFLDAMEKQPN